MAARVIRLLAVLFALLAVPAALPAGAAFEGSPPETVEADVSSRSVAVTTDFDGVEIVVFGTVNNSRQASAEAGYYDVVVVVEGTHTPLVARKKSRVAGLWINTAAVRFASLPSYYAISSTRPIDEVAEKDVLNANEIGFEHVPMRATPKGRNESTSEEELKKFKQAVVRLKQKEGLFVRQDYGVAFIGKSLFRSTIALPANVPLGQLVAKVYLFREGKMLSSYSAKFQLNREGVERYLYDFSRRYPLFYGLFAVAVAVAAGLAASAVFRKGSH